MVTKKRIVKDVKHYGSDVIRSDEMRKAFSQKHHIRSTVGEHTLRVVSSSLLMCYFFEKFHINLDIRAVVVASLCHDLGMVGRNEKFSSGKECFRNHPKDSLNIARELVGKMPEKTEDIINRHMWPIGKTKAPNSIEGVIVSVADKYNAVKDLLKGSSVRCG